jgi:2-C-methyl-D-erythritol 4-phosphate cytidylyltransferase
MDMSAETVHAIIVAAGSSTRMGGQDKLLANLGGRPVLAWTLRAFQDCPAIDQVVVALSPENAQAAQSILLQFSKVTHTSMGGLRRQDSVRNALYSLPTCDFVVVHDGARPFVTPNDITRGIEAARSAGSAIAALPVVDTLKAVWDGAVTRTVPRAGLWAAQTPQVFAYDLLLEAHEQVTEDVTDDCAMVERLGSRVVVYEGSRLNFKITTPDDLLLAEALVSRVRRRAAR